MKKNSKGFTLVETLIVSAFVIGTLTYLFIQINNSITNYDIAFKYDAVHDVRKEGVVNVDGGAHPVGFLNVAGEGIHVAEGSVFDLGGHLPPHIPGIALFVFQALISRGSGLIAVAGAVDAGAVGDEDQIVFGEGDGFRFSTQDDFDSRCDFVGIVFGVEEDVLHFAMRDEAHPMLGEVLHQGEDHRLVLVITGEAEGCEIRKPIDAVDETLQITLHLQGAAPFLEGEHGLPIKPEIGTVEVIVEAVADLLVLQILLGGEEELEELILGFFVQGEVVPGGELFPAVGSGPAKRVVGVFFVQPTVFVEDGNVGIGSGGNVFVNVPHDFEMVVHFPAPAHDEPVLGVVVAVARHAREGVPFEDFDPLAFDLGVADQIEGRGEAGQAAADDVGALFVRAFRLLRMGEGFVVSC